MFGVHCFVVQVLHRRRKRGGGGGVGCLPLFGVHCFVVQCFIGIGRGGGEAHPIIFHIFLQFLCETEKK